MAKRTSSSDLTEGAVLKHLLRFVGPMSLGLIATMTTGLVDAFWLGRLGAVELAAVSFAFPVSFMTFAVAIGLSSGAVAAISRAKGAGDRTAVQALTTDALLLALLVTVVVAAIGVATINPLFRALGADGELLEFVHDYMSVWYFSLPFVIGQVIGGAVLRSLGQAITPTLLLAITAVVNLILDPLLIFGVGPFPRLEVSGAALATALAAMCSFIAAGFIVAGREKLIRFRAAPLKQRLRHWREICHVGVPAMISTGINPLALTLVIASMARFGEGAVAGFGVAARIEQLAAIPLLALSAAMAPMTGQNDGAGRPDRVAACFRAAFAISLVWSGVTALLLLIFGGWLAGLFVDPTDPLAEEVEAVARTYLLILPITSWGYGVVIAGSAGFNGLSRPLPGLAMPVFRSLVLFAPAAWLGGVLWNAPIGVLWGMAAANVLAGVLVGGWIMRFAYPTSATSSPAAAE